MSRAVGRRLAGSASSAATASAPASGVCSAATVSRSSGSMPAPRMASQ
ncbi:MAG TPA: hypothetical protein VHV09_24570 [Trebonia sp.]|nr:hypothetical protein [Trebonia sp.]